MSDILDPLPAMLTRLKLTAMRDQLDTLLDEAVRKDMTLRDTLSFLYEAEIAQKDQRRIAMAMSIAKFPAMSSLRRQFLISLDTCNTIHSL